MKNFFKKPTLPITLEKWTDMYKSYLVKNALLDWTTAVNILFTLAYTLFVIDIYQYIYIKVYLYTSLYWYTYISFYVLFFCQSTYVYQ